MAQASQTFATRCVPCHGPEGGGDGPAASALNPRPRNFHDRAWQGSASDEEILTAIQNGGMSVGKSAIMPGNPDFKGNTELLAALLAKIRAFGQ
jgi:mono/diheme cytochrome c family protein